MMADTNSIAILYTGDIHGHVEPWRGWSRTFRGKTIGGLDRLSTAVEQARADFGKANTLLLDSGDAVADTMIATETKGVAVIEVMNAIGYDAMTLGNHEFDYGIPQLEQIIQQAKFSIIAANVRRKDGGQLLTKPYLIREFQGTKVGVIGLGYPNTPLTTAKKNVAEVTFEQSPDALRKILPEVRAAGAQIIVVLSHYGLGADIQLAKEVAGIDVIVGGHSHNRTEQPQVVGSTLIVHAGAHGSDLGILKLEIQDGRIHSHQNRLVLLDNDEIASDAKVHELIQKAISPLQNQLQEKIVSTGQPLARAQTIAGGSPRKRDEVSPVDSLFADLARKASGADIAILPGVGYGIALPKGTVTASDLRNLLPHQSKLVMITLTGAQLREIVEQSIENTLTRDPAKKVGGIIQVSGLNFTYDSSADFGERVKELKSADHPVRDDAEYKVVTNSMLVDGGHNYSTFRSGKNKTEVGDFYELIKAELQRENEISLPTDTRFRDVSEREQEISKKITTEK